MKQALLDNVKNMFGWRTRRRLLVFSVDDYGNVRLSSQKAREQMDRAGLKVHSRFDAYDTLENREDLEQLFGVLTSVKDTNGKGAVFTPYALSCNIDFERLAARDYTGGYCYEYLPETFSKLAAFDPAAYEGAWNLWQEGIAKGIMAPQFHGREHLNLKVFEEKLAKRDPEMLTALENRSYTSLSGSGYPSINYTVSFAFWEEREIAVFPQLISTGLEAFQTVFGYPATVFTPPAQQFPAQLYKMLPQQGIRAIDRPFFLNQHEGKGSYRKKINITGQKGEDNLITIVRNVVFEPTDDRNIDWLAYTLQQIETAFRWNRPAIVSSHRVNFCGHIDPRNREKGLTALKTLLKKIVQRWPEVEFISAAGLADLIADQSGS